MSVFQFKYFSIIQEHSALKVGTDAMVLGALIVGKDKKRGLDIGSGTGVIALMVAQQHPNLHLLGIELDPDSALDCDANFKQSPWSNRLDLVVGDFLAHPFNSKFDLIFSNPPYFENSLENSNIKKSVARHTKSLPFEQLFIKVSDLLLEDGSYWVILPFIACDRAVNLAKESGMYSTEKWIIEGKPNHPVRVVFHFQKLALGSSSCITHTFVIRNADGSYSEEYIRATEMFHNRELRSTPSAEG